MKKYFFFLSKRNFVLSSLSSPLIAKTFLSPLRLRKGKKKESRFNLMISLFFQRTSIEKNTGIKIKQKIYEKKSSHEVCNNHLIKLLRHCQYRMKFAQSEKVYHHNHHSKEERIIHFSIFFLKTVFCSKFFLFSFRENTVVRVRQKQNSSRS
eukprot:GDKJ01047613.1.p1 GENE.GDKJ01047613.1~~GDKJ01047613.1.p1  ORF type:complete len:152 (-),score=26.91 GDKJ01047613.1:122-577(-)